MMERLTTQELLQFDRLALDLKIAYLDAATVPEHRADCEAIRKGICDRLKPYICPPGILAESLLDRVLGNLQGVVE